jgi:cysteine desulfurase
LHHLEANDIFVGLGSACSAQSKEPSKILTAMGVGVDETRCSLRISYGLQNTLEETETFLAEFIRAYEALYPTFSKNKSKR